MSSWARDRSGNGANITRPTQWWFITQSIVNYQTRICRNSFRITFDTNRLRLFFARSGWVTQGCAAFQNATADCAKFYWSIRFSKSPRVRSIIGAKSILITNETIAKWNAIFVRTLDSLTLNLFFFGQFKRGEKESRERPQKAAECRLIMRWNNGSLM